LLGTEIKYTVKMNISVVQKIVDEMGGLYFHIPADMYYYDNGIDLLLEFMTLLRNL
jgi:anionic cell wall polymer biosynthesis LytR-Cps2A-Psr (LCP) family protein